MRSNSSKPSGSTSTPVTPFNYNDGSTKIKRFSAEEKTERTPVKRKTPVDVSTPRGYRPRRSPPAQIDRNVTHLKKRVGWTEGLDTAAKQKQRQEEESKKKRRDEEWRAERQRKMREAEERRRTEWEAAMKMKEDMRRKRRQEDEERRARIEQEQMLEEAKRKEERMRWEAREAEKQAR